MKMNLYHFIAVSLFNIILFKQLNLQLIRYEMKLLWMDYHKEFESDLYVNCININI